MFFEIWLAFALACVAILAVPGPTVLLVVSYVMRQGKESGWATVPGVILGDFVAMSASLLGAGAVLQASATLFLLMKIIGALYLLWLGIKMWRSSPQLEKTKAGTGRKTSWAIFTNTFVVTALNPKTIVFFVAFLPQFVDPAFAVLPQFMVMEATFLILAFINIILWVLFVARMRQAFSNPTKLQLLNRIGGSFLITAGILSAVGTRS